MYNNNKPPNSTNSNLRFKIVLYTHDGVYAIGFPSLDTVESIVDSTEEFYEQKIKRMSDHNKLRSISLDYFLKWE